MIKYAVVFAGQGAQKPGMGKSLYEANSAAREIFDRAGEEIKFDCFEADAERLKQTEVTQPAVYTMDMAAYAALRWALEARGDEGGFQGPSCVAGFSLGEYAAFTAAGAISSFEEGLAIVKTRAQLMKMAGANSDGSQRGAMAAGIGEEDAVLDLVDLTRGDDVLEAVNFNSSQQTVVAGDAAAVARFTEMAAGNRSLGVKAITLSVSGAFHSTLMRPAAEGLTEALSECFFEEPSLPVYLNVTGGTYSEYSEMAVGRANAKIKALMVSQIQSPVYWKTIVEAIAADGVEVVVEVGPGKTLTGLIKKITPELCTLHVEDAESLAETVDFFRQTGGS